MSLVNPLLWINKVKNKNIAIPAFNVYNLETVKAVIEGAKEEKAPVIIQTTPGTLKFVGINVLSKMVESLSNSYDIPIALHLDHCSSYKTVIKCIKNRYTSVMIDGSKLSYEDNIKIVKEVVKVAKATSVSVEAELGKIRGTEDEITVKEKEESLTVPEEALEFANITDVDMLAVAIGTAHGVYKGEPILDFERLEAINNIVDIPLVLHGASGVPEASVVKAVERGICKVNIATELKIPMAEALKTSFKKNPEQNDPRKYMGLAIDAVKNVVKKKIKMCGADNLISKVGF